jgi:hypothetical protein
MALTNLSSSGITYLTVADGNLVQQLKTPTEKTVERITKTGKLVHEQKFRDLTGKIIGIETQENDFGKQWKIKFTDGESTYIVSMNYSSRYASSFLKALPNVDKSQDVRFMPWSMKDKLNAEKMITGITMYQGSDKILPAFTKDDPNGLPQMVKIKVKGKETWDDSEMMEFLEEKAKQWIGSNPVVSDDAPF